MDVNNWDTKSQIFNVSLRLFAMNGYENVSIRAIAEAVGIKTASIYYHFSSKEQILLACYDFYIKHRHTSRLCKEQYEPIIRNASKKEVLDVLNYAFPDSVLENMLLSLLIIFSRIYSDPKAKELYADDINCSMKYLDEFFSLGIEIGRFNKFNITAVSLIILSSRLFVGQSITLAPEQKSDWQQSGLEMFDELLNLIPFKY